MTIALVLVLFAGCKTVPFGMRPVDAIELIDANSSLGKTLLDLYQAQNNLLVFQDDEKTWTFLTNTTPERFKLYLMGLRNYRAGYRPADPPVRSGDALRAPSPNAK